MANRLDPHDPITATHLDAMAESARIKEEEIFGPKAHRFTTPQKAAM